VLRHVLTLQRIDFAKAPSTIVASLKQPVRAKRPREEEEGETEEPAAVRAATGENPQAEGATASGTVTGTLLASDLPASVTQEALEEVCGKYPGFVSARVPPGERGVAFLEYEDSAAASQAMEALNGFRIVADYALNLSVAT
jgi:U2 small nuclear ribonucleoprotein B''